MPEGRTLASGDCKLHGFALGKMRSFVGSLPPGDFSFLDANASLLTDRRLFCTGSERKNACVSFGKAPLYLVSNDRTADRQKKCEIFEFFKAKNEGTQKYKIFFAFSVVFLHKMPYFLFPYKLVAISFLDTTSCGFSIDFPQNICYTIRALQKRKILPRLRGTKGET